jgi:hypothetical protein
VCAQFLLDQLQGEEGLLLHIASFFPPRETMALTTGFAMGRIVPSWVCATVRGGRDLCWHPMHDGQRGWDGANVPVAGQQPVTDGIVRIDCAIVDAGAGQFLVAGGCADHPSRARSFFRSAFLYDALTHVATALPDMPHERHGCSGARLGDSVYVIGGEYQARDPEAACAVSVFDLSTRRWCDTRRTPINTTLRDLSVGTSIAFSPVGAIDGRVVLLLNGKVVAYNPEQPETGWIACGRPGDADSASVLGTNACASTCWGRHFVVATGRNGSKACEVMAFSFLHPPSAAGGDESGPLWSMGQWTALGATGATSRVGCGLVVVHDRLYVSGGFIEANDGSGGSFDGSVAMWTGTRLDLPAPSAETLSDVAQCKRPWRKLEGLELPTAMHAHHAIAIPWLPRSA